MKKVLPLHGVEKAGRSSVGGKSLMLSKIGAADLNVPETLCITAAAYNEYLDRTGLRERILLELHRKDQSQMRWEEIWDAATRIRAMFVNTAIPRVLEAELQRPTRAHFKNNPVVVRSSAVDEDSSRASFAGLHESLVNVRGAADILGAVRKVWASLWSDAAILYRREIGLNAETSAMAVIVQEMILGRSSGVTFSRNPNDESQTVIESVHGLNQGLVDGRVEPDRWLVDRASGKILSHTPAHRKHRMVPDSGRVKLEPLPHGLKKEPPLTGKDVSLIFETAQQLEVILGGPQDIEWTLSEDRLYILQSRPVTTTWAEDPEDRRTWYLSLHRSFENLKALRAKIEKKLIPEMIRASSRMAAREPAGLSDAKLAQEIGRRRKTNQKWVDIYWSDFIPFAHGIRLFGQVYNDTVRPGNPYEFVDLLGQTSMVSLERNQMLEDLAEMVRSDPELKKKLQNRDSSASGDRFMRAVESFIRQFGDLSCPVTGATQCSQGPEALIRIVLEMANHLPAGTVPSTSENREALTRRFLEHFPAKDRAWAQELLELARSSYRLRDDDNIHLGRIEAQVLAAVDEGRRRIAAAQSKAKATPGIRRLREALQNHHAPEAEPPEEKSARQGMFALKGRQLVGQPAGPGLSRGSARVIVDNADLSEFKHGEILVCDAVDPNMTFVVPLASGIVERRGGMLIHGAIIAREYGLPCVTGVPDATRLIETGDPITVDGYLGIVTIGRPQAGVKT